MSEMQNELNRYYEEVGIAFVEAVIDGNGYYNYRRDV